MDSRYSEHPDYGLDRTGPYPGGSRDTFNALGAENLFVSAGNRSVTGNPNAGVPDAQRGMPRTAQFSARLSF